MKSPIFSGFNEDRTKSGSSDICINLYPEITLDEQGHLTFGVLLERPGLSAPLCTVGTGPVRGMFTSKSGLLYVVSREYVYTVSAAWVVTQIGQIGSYKGPVSIIENPTQILIVDGYSGWCYDTIALTFKKVIPNSDTDADNPTVAVYQDGFGLVNSSGTNQIYQSNYNDLSKYASLTGSGGATANNAYIQGNAKDVLALFDLKQEVWVFKKDAMEVWINQGSAGFAFAPLQGVYLPVGILAPASVARLGDSIVWLGASDNGIGNVFKSSGYNYKNITPSALSKKFSDSRAQQATAYSYQSEGHNFYVLSFDDETWAYDDSSGKWAQRATFIGGSYGREIPNCHAEFNGMNLVGDATTGHIYQLVNDSFTDNGQPIRWARSWMAAESNVPISFNSLKILMETGITVTNGSNPQVDLRFSDDGGYTWNGPFQMPAGKIGETAWRVMLNRLGSTSHERGLERVWEISSSDSFLAKITGAEWEGGPA